ncbi:hypothetical protein MNBD_GAMMA22-1206 [hydrothermal vent metagenome]|uniref:Uncharacterized protein n=1 Tax=hydrothermal vent metagenome TaxID=652676 RepID=A0A3B1AE08_9ZZZZ
MNEIYLQNSFEFGTLLMNKLDSIKEYNYRCIECNYEITTKSDYKFNYVFKSASVNKTLHFSYTPSDDNTKCAFTVTIESRDGKTVRLDELITADSSTTTTDIFNCDSYTGNITSKIQHFVENLNNNMSNRFDEIVNDS